MPAPILIGDSPVMQQLRAQVARFGRSEAAVLITGPSGSGKELVARALHHHSRRRDCPFVVLNCGAIPPELLESELFGVRRGAYTGADQHRDGLLLSAKGGSVLLDEIAELPLALQVKLLRVVQEKRVRPLGGTQERVIDVRWLAATHQNLPQRMAQHQFRTDLYYRLAVLELVVPGLAQRREDIPALAQHLLSVAVQAQATGHAAPTLTAAAIEALQQHHFPGQVRQLDNHLQRGLALAEHGRIDAHHLGLCLARCHQVAELDSPALDAELATLERQRLQAALALHPHSQQAAAQALGISPRALRYRLKKHGIAARD